MWLETHYPWVAASLWENLEETLTMNRLEGQSLARRRDGAELGGAAFQATEKNFRRIQGYHDFWMLKSKLENEAALDSKQKAA